MEKKITKEDYLRKKGLLPKEPLGTIFCFRSSREGVSEIKELLIWEKVETGGWRGNRSERISIQNYKMNETPYNAQIWSDELVAENAGFGSGFGDLWAWSWFSSLDKNELEKSRQKEILRVAGKYGVNSNQLEITF
jgi:hypothetical protein